MIVSFSAISVVGVWPWATEGHRARPSPRTTGPRTDFAHRMGRILLIRGEGGLPTATLSTLARSGHRGPVSGGGPRRRSSWNPRWNLSDNPGQSLVRGGE